MEQWKLTRDTRLAAACGTLGVPIRLATTIIEATGVLQYTDPTIVFAFKAFISAAAGLAIAHPGSQVTELANFAAARHGFDPEQGIMVYEDPSDELDNENPDAISFNVVGYPFVEA